MLCRDYEHLWNQQLDAGPAAAPDLVRELEVHAEQCAACRPIAQRYRVLRQALGTWGPPPVPSAGFTDRVLAARDGLGAEPRSLRLVRSPMARWAAAAAVLLAVALAVRVEPRRDDRPIPAPPPPPSVVAGRSLGEALAEATSATLDLARANADPAARVGRRMLDAATSAEPVPDLTAGPSAIAEVVPTVGDRVGAGVRPLSGTARQAFSFLLVEAQ